MSESPNWSNPLRDSRDLRLPRIAGPCSLVIFGVTGDLAQKKLLPAVYDLANRGLLPPSFGLTGFARRDWTQERFIEFVKAAVQAHCRTPFKESTWRNLAAGIRFVQGTFDDPEAFERLSATVQELDRDRGTQGNHAFYMSVPPRAFPQVAKQLAASGLSRSSEGAWRRVIIEKPFGHDLASAKELDSVVSEVFDPSSVFRIDHYLGKETVQNLLALRFANAMYEPIWNANYVDHVQITMAEDIGIGGRAGYYDGIGAARDVIQNHLLQLMALTAMEEPVSFGLTGFARRDWTQERFIEFVKAAVQAHCRTPFKESTWRNLAAGIRFVQGTFDDPEAFERLSATVQELDRDRGTQGNHAFYMSVPPRAFPQVAKQLAASGLSRSSEGAWRRVIIEKPFGHDLASAKELDSVVSEVFDPSSVFRIDHYLGKETVQNLLALRFANAMYEPIWNANYVDHVQITMAEDIGIGGRAGYYDGIGAARDVIQNHLLQLMALTAMEEPVSFTAKDLTAEKTKVLSAVRLPKDLAANTARGQYAKGWQGSHEVVGYLEEKGIDPKSTTETYAAIRLDIDTRRWAGVPFYLRCGKRLGKRVTEIAVVFKRAPHLPFEQTAVRELGKNAIVIRVQPDEGVTMRFGAKVPGGSTMEVRDVNMDFSYGRSFTENSPEAYERLILDVLLGDPPLFPTTEEVNLSWEILDPIEQFWSTLGQPQAYRAGTWGPAQADEMLARDGRHWRMP